MATFLGALPAYAARRHAFRSPAGFSLTYSAPWTPRGAKSDELLLLSPGRSVQGPIIGQGQAAILVRALGSAPSVAAYDRLMADRGDGAYGRRQVTALAPKGDCADLLEIDMRDEAGRGPVELDSSFYCRARGRVIVVQLTQYAGDSRGALYRRAALALAGTLRLDAPRRG